MSGRRPSVGEGRIEARAPGGSEGGREVFPQLPHRGDTTAAADDTGRSVTLGRRRVQDSGDILDTQRTSVHEWSVL